MLLPQKCQGCGTEMQPHPHSHPMPWALDLSRGLCPGCLQAQREAKNQPGSKINKRLWKLG